ASKLVGWDIEIMTHDELNEGIERAEGWFSEIPNVTPEQVEAFIEEGFLSYDDLTFLEPAELGELAGIDEEQAQDLVDYAEEASERVEEERRRDAQNAEATRAAAPAPTAADKVARLFPGEPVALPAPEAKPTFESLFRPANESAAVPEEAGAASEGAGAMPE